MQGEEVSDAVDASNENEEESSGSETLKDPNSDTGVSDSTNKGHWTDGIGTYILLGVMLIAFIGFYIYNNRQQKKRAAEAQKQLDAIKPGTKIKTIGGVCGVVTEVDEDSFVLQTGGKEKSFVTFDKRAVAESDAVVEEEKKEEKEEEKPKKEKKAKKEEAVEESVEEKAEEKTEEANDKE